MSRFNSSGTFLYAPAQDSFSGALGTIYLDPSQMPQYPFSNYTFTDRTTYRSKSGKSWSYQNYNGDGFTFRWSMLDETCKNSLRTMYDSLPFFTFVSGTNTLGTFRMADSSWKDEEVAHELYDLSFTVEEANP